MNPFHWAVKPSSWRVERDDVQVRPDVSTSYILVGVSQPAPLVQKLKFKFGVFTFHFLPVVRFFTLSSTICLNWFVYYAEPAYAKASKSSPFRSEVATNRFGGVHFFWEVCFGAEVVLHQADIFIEHV